MPSFDAFYKAINRRNPFPWQARLAAELAETERWRADIGVQTGLGKTACLDIAIWWLAYQALRDPERRTAPTRIWWVVNRRLLVDATAEHAEFISRALADPASEGIADDSADIVTAVADRLRALSADATGTKPLEVIRLRGGITYRRPVDPSKPTILLSTLPMYGSRLLFRGYGSTQSMRPIDAALAGIDSLVILDEAHLAPHLRALIPALAECTPQSQPVLCEGRTWPRLVALTATGDPGNRDRFELDAEDEAHPVVVQRLDAAKPMELLILKPGDAGPPLTQATLDLLGEAEQPSACVVFANTPSTARMVFSRLKDRMKAENAEILLLTGRVREREAERIRERVLDPVDGMAANRDATASRRRHLIVVTTQTLEVGADLDAEYLVTEACGVRALTQRLGRLNRLGRHSHARALYVHRPPKPRRSGGPAKPTEAWPVYGEEPKALLVRLQNAGGGSPVNLSPRRVAEILGSPSDDPGRAPEVLPGILEEWIKTTTPPDGEAPVEPYFSGIAGTDYRVALLWRAHVPEDGKWLWPRPIDREEISVPIREFRESLDEDEEVHRIDGDGVTIRRVPKASLKPGDTVVLPSDRGLMDAFGWNPTSTQPVMDLSIVERGVPLDDGALRRLGALTMDGLVDRALGLGDDDEDLDETDRAEALKQIRTKLSEVSPPGWAYLEWQELIGALHNGQLVHAPNEIPWLLLSGRSSGRGAHSDAHDEMSLAETAVHLDRHGEAVGERAREVAKHVGLASDLVEILQQAGRLHDIGKADLRFQRWLDPEGKHGVKIAKSNLPRYRWYQARVAAGWPRGGRHETLSARLVRRWIECCPGSWGSSLQELLLHLIMSHHGSARPLVRPVEDGTRAVVSAVVDGVSVETLADLSIIDWEQPARFRHLCERFGPWGLALLEAIVRQSDHAVSAGLDVDQTEVS